MQLMMKTPKFLTQHLKSKTQGDIEIHEIETSLTVGENDTNEIEEKTRDAAEALSEPVISHYCLQGHENHGSGRA